MQFLGVARGRKRKNDRGRQSRQAKPAEVRIIGRLGEHDVPVRSHRRAQLERTVRTVSHLHLLWPFLRHSQPL